jgi:hypothetical protein
VAAGAEDLKTELKNWWDRRGRRRDQENPNTEGLCSSGCLVEVEEHKDATYVPQLLDLADEHKSLCSSGIWPGRET